MSSIKRNFLYNSAYQMLNIIIPLITTPYLSRSLQAKGVGIYSYAYTVAYYFVIVSMLGLNNYGNRAIAMCRDDFDKRSKTFFEIYLMQFGSTTIRIVIYVLFLFLFTEGIMGWVFLPFVVSTMFDINWFFFGMEKFKITVLRNSVVKIATTILIFLFVNKPEDVFVYGMIMSSGFLISQMLLWPFLKDEVKYIFPSFKRVLRHLKPNMM